MKHHRKSLTLTQEQKWGVAMRLSVANHLGNVEAFERAVQRQIRANQVALAAMRHQRTGRTAKLLRENRLARYALRLAPQYR